MTVMFLFGSLTATCGVLQIDPFRQLAACGQQSCRYGAILYETDIAAVQVECLPELLLRSSYEVDDV